MNENTSASLQVDWTWLAWKCVESFGGVVMGEFADMKQQAPYIIQDIDTEEYFTGNGRSDMYWNAQRYVSYAAARKRIELINPREHATRIVIA